MEEINNTSEALIIKNEKITNKVLSSLKGLRFGSVVITVHNSRVVQIDRIEKSRFDDLQLEFGDGI